MVGGLTILLFMALVLGYGNGGWPYYTIFYGSPLRIG